MSQQRRRGRAWKPDATGTRCVRCARTWNGHAGTSCYPVPDPAIDAFDPARPELLEFGDVDDASRRTSPLHADQGTVEAVVAAAVVEQADVARDASRTATAGPRDGS